MDEPLSETGFQQAAAAGVFLSNVRFTHAFSSDLTRTRQVRLGPARGLMGHNLKRGDPLTNPLPDSGGDWVTPPLGRTGFWVSCCHFASFW